jgi:hypothetical protein
MDDKGGRNLDRVTRRKRAYCHDLVTHRRGEWKYQKRAQFKKLNLASQEFHAAQDIFELPKISTAFVRGMSLRI